MTKVGIFGGSFNPPHVGHLHIAASMRDTFDLNRILWIPSYSPPHKASSQLASPEHRFNMTRLAIAGNPNFSLSDHEIQRKGTSYTIDTLKALQEANPEISYSLLIGEDSLEDFHTWKHPDQIVERVPLLVYKRPGTDSSKMAAFYGKRVHFAEGPLLPLSGTTLRQRILSGQSVRYLVPETVRHYITTHRLYNH